MTQSADQDLVAVCTLADPIEASLASDFFAASHVPCTINDNHAPIKLLVSKKHADKAIALAKVWEIHRNNNAAAKPTASDPLHYTKWMIGMSGALVVSLIFFMFTNWIIGGKILIVFLIWTPFAVYMIHTEGVRPYLLWRHLMTLGYEWPTKSDALMLLMEHGKEAWRLWPAADVEMLPGIQRNWRGLGNFLNYRKQHKKLCDPRKRMKP
ncbi:MAG: hypothetical protein ABFD69_03445 [Candidatus Sumerlaeia bacterium]